MKPAPLALCCLLAFGSTAGAQDRISSVDLADPAGGIHRLEEWEGRQAVALFFVGVECPVSNFYAPEMARIQAEYAERCVAVLLVYAEPDMTPERAAAHAKEYGLTMLALIDSRQALARQARVDRVPTVVVAAPDGAVLYRGRIDDRYSEDGRRRDEPTTHDLRDALEAVLAGKAPPATETPGFGCPLPEVSSGPR